MVRNIYVNSYIKIYLCIYIYMYVCMYGFWGVLTIGGNGINRPRISMTWCRSSTPDCKGTPGAVGQLTCSMMRQRDGSLIPCRKKTRRYTFFWHRYSKSMFCPIDLKLLFDQPDVPTKLYPNKRVLFAPINF